MLQFWICELRIPGFQISNFEFPELKFCISESLIWITEIVRLNFNSVKFHYSCRPIFNCVKIAEEAASETWQKDRSKLIFYISAV
jgi:hypothetical protein